MKPFFMFLISLCASGVRAQDSFTLPPNAMGNPDYLERMKVKDTSRRLSEKEKHQLCRLFAKVSVRAAREYDQDFLLNTDAPIYRLLVANFPEVASRQSEGGIFLGEITSFFNSLPEYRGDVIQVLREGISRKYCKKEG
jgi:hypothetical protein